MKQQSKNRIKNQPNIYLRLITGLLLLLLLSVSISIFYIRDIKNLNRTINNVLRHPYTVSNNVRDINIYINAMHRSMKDVVLAKNDVQLNIAVEKVNGYEKEVFQKFEIISERFLGNPETIKDAHNYFANWKTIRDKVIVLTKKKQFDEAADITKGEGASYVDILLSKTNNMIEFADNKAINFHEESLQVLRSVFQKAFIFICIALTIGILTFFWIIKSINGPLNKIIGRIKNIPYDQLINTFPKNEKNKLVLLEFVFDELEDYKKKLESLVNERSKELKESREIITRSIDNAPIGIVEVDLSGKFKKVNQEFCNILGYPQKELLNLTFNDITVAEDKEIGIEIVKKIIEGEVSSGKIEKRYIHKSGKIIHCSLTTTLVHALNNNPLYFFTQIVDITKQKQYEEELIHHKEQLETIVQKRTKQLDEKAKKLYDSQKALTYLVEDVNESRVELERTNRKYIQANKELEAFSYSVSHDLKAPLRAVIGFSEILKEDFGSQLEQEASRYLSLISNNARNMAELINDLLDFSKLGRSALYKSNIDLARIATDVKTEMQNGITDRKLNIIIHPMPLVNADEKLMYHVLQNLISNAVKFTVNTTKAKVEIGCSKQKNSNVYFVRDNGIGFNMKYADKIFDVFQRLHSPEEYPGTGIGLAIVHQIIRKHEGTVWVESKINEGTTFFFKV